MRNCLSNLRTMFPFSLPVLLFSRAIRFSHFISFRVIIYTLAFFKFFRPSRNIYIISHLFLFVNTFLQNFLMFFKIFKKILKKKRRRATVRNSCPPQNLILSNVETFRAFSYTYLFPRQELCFLFLGNTNCTESWYRTW